MPPTPFRSFSLDDFRETKSWSRLADILSGTGGCYGLYGPRGAGKTWLMLRAITEADRENGLGLWFPCPSEYRASEFLASLSDTLAAAVQQRFLRDSSRARAMRWLEFVLGGFAGLLVALAVGVYVARGLSGGNANHGSLISVFPAPLWLVVGIAIALLLVLLGAQVVWERRPAGRLAREATAMRERIRYSASLRLGTEVHLGRDGSLAGSLRRARERALDERPVTIASLVFDFRHLARLILEVLHGPLVIGVDELDKIVEPEVARSLLREVKGIFEIAGAFFLISVSEEAAGSLGMGPLLPEGRNEFNSSFYTVLELPPLDPEETVELLVTRGMQGNRHLAQVLCVLGEGNWREIVRMAEYVAFFPDGASGQHLGDLIMKVCEAETSSLLREITRNIAGTKTGQLADEAKLGAWNALPPDTFKMESRFIQLSKVAIHEYWKPRWHDAAAWQTFHGMWQRLLIRLFMGGRIIVTLERLAGTDAATADDMMTDLRNVMIMASRSPGVAKSMLADRFGVDLDGPYRPPVP